MGTASLLYLEMGLLQDPGQLGGAVVLHLQAADVPQDLRHQLHIVVLHRLQLHLLRVLMSLGRGGGGGGGREDLDDAAWLASSFLKVIRFL